MSRCDFACAKCGYLTADCLCIIENDGPAPRPITTCYQCGERFERVDARDYSERKCSRCKANRAASYAVEVFSREEQARLKKNLAPLDKQHGFTAPKNFAGRPMPAHHRRRRLKHDYKEPKIQVIEGEFSSGNDTECVLVIQEIVKKGS